MKPGAPDPALRGATAADQPDILALLAASGLPTGDLKGGALPHFIVAEGAGCLMGCAAVETFASAGLLRSLAVAPEARGTGLGSRLLAAAERIAREAGLHQLYLLTTDQGGFFANHGYHAEERAQVPAAILAHPQFAGLCPASARCYAKFIQEIPMKNLEVFDPAMCCSTGVCGVEVDPVLAQFAADLKWAEAQGVSVSRHNLSQEPQAFAANPAVVKELEAGMDRLPVILVDGRIVSTGMYPSRQQLAQKLGLTASAEAAPAKSCCAPKTGCC